jgi:3-hydroxyacyl-[acyl-carrier-protein] dehydratase
MAFTAAPHGGTAVLEGVIASGPVLTGTSRVDPDAVIFQGHYPGCPLVPGLLLVEQAHAIVAASRYGRDRHLAAVERARFLKPVLPDDDLTLTIRLEGETEPSRRAGGDMRCSATISNQLGRVAVVRLRYAAGAQVAERRTAEPAARDQAAAVAGVAAIKSRIPHRDPVLLVDRVLRVEPGVSLTAAKDVTDDEPSGRWVAETMGSVGEGVYPMGLVLESWAQAAVLLICWDRPNPEVVTGNVALGISFSDVEVCGPVYAGDVLEHHVELVKTLGDVATLRGSCRVGGRTVARIGDFIEGMRPAATLLVGRPGGGRN